jgi:hypothetical protein
MRWPCRTTTHTHPTNAMGVRIAAAVIVCLATAGAGGCAQQTSCDTADYSASSASQTPRQALDAVLAKHVQWLSLTGWVITSRSANGVTFAAGNDTVDVLKTSGGRWFAAGVTACQ